MHRREPQSATSGTCEQETSAALQDGKRAPQSPSAFTLVELLVVIGIIALLISILMPALSAARKQARLVKCLSNLQQMGTAFQMYINDNKGQCWQCAYGGIYAWEYELGQYINNVPTLQFCPEATDPSVPTSATASIWGGDFQAWMQLGSVGSYGMNAWLSPNYQVAGVGLVSSGYPWGINIPSDTITLPDPQSNLVPIFGDCNWCNGWPQSTDAPSANLNNGDGSNMQRFCIDRHGKVTNLVFLDGHAESVSLPGLWQLKWNENFTPTTVTIP